MSVYAIGDIHGCLKALKVLMEAIVPKKKDTFVFLGDYVDRGPQSKEVIDWIIAFREKHKVITLKGNHEIMMLNALDDPEYAVWWKDNGGYETLTSFGLLGDKEWPTKIPDQYLDFLRDALPYYKAKKTIFVHAGLTPGVRLREQTDKALYWKKYHVPEAFSNKKRVVAGHTVRKDGKIANFGHSVGIDTYAYGGMWLTCLNIRTGQYWQASQAGDILQSSIELPKRSDQMLR